jgi:acyl-CoA thioesterase I
MILRLSGQMVLLALIVNVAISLVPSTLAATPDRPVRIVALGDSLTAGYGLGPGEALPAVLERLMEGAGKAVEIQNAGVSGDTTGGGLARLDWAVPEGSDGVILALGANDMLTGQSIERAQRNIDAILVRLKARNLPVLLAGMRASRSLGDDYANAFDKIYADLAQKHDVLFYPFLLDGVVLDPKLNQPDGIHPTAEGIRRIAERMLPFVKELTELAAKSRVSVAK